MKHSKIYVIHRYAWSQFLTLSFMGKYIFYAFLNNFVLPGLQIYFIVLTTWKIKMQIIWTMLKGHIILVKVVFEFMVYFGRWAERVPIWAGECSFDFTVSGAYTRQATDGSWRVRRAPKLILRFAVFCLRAALHHFRCYFALRIAI